MVSSQSKTLSSPATAVAKNRVEAIATSASKVLPEVSRASSQEKRIGKFEALSLLLATLHSAVAFAPSAPTLARHAEAFSTIASPRPEDLLVVGAGNLGRRVAAIWHKEYPDARVVGATLTEASHPLLVEAGLEPITVEALVDAPFRRRFQNVIFTAPPPWAGTGTSPSSSYAHAISQAASFWGREVDPDIDTGLGSSFVFTSSAGVFAENDGGRVDEMSPVAQSPGALQLLAGEESALRAKGTVLRLSGLFDEERSPHKYWLKTNSIKGNPEGLVNMLHYEDAASAVVAALLRGSDASGKVYVVADGTPLTRTSIVEATCGAFPEACVDGPVFECLGEVMCDHCKGKGKVLVAGRARKELQWAPSKSFQKFMHDL